MSWDVLLLNVPPEIKTGDDFPKDFSSSLGPHKQVLSTLKALFPKANFADPTWVVLQHTTFSIEFNIGDDDPVDVIMLHVRGSDGALSIIQRICEHTGWRAFDPSTGDFINFAEDAARGLRQWRALRDRVVASLEAKSETIVSRHFS